MAETPTTTQSPTTAEADPGTGKKDGGTDTVVDPKAGDRSAVVVPGTQRPLTAEADPGTDDKDQKQDTTLDPKGAGGRGAAADVVPPADR